jgi:hypothetical protein
MAPPIHTRLSPGEGRRFGLTVGGAFFALTMLTWWNGRAMLAGVLAIVATCLVVAGIAVPTRLGPVERAWMTFGRAISFFTTPIVMGVLYFVIITPVGLLRRAVAPNPIVHRESASGFWKRRAKGRSSSMERQF